MIIPPLIERGNYHSLFYCSVAAHQVSEFLYTFQWKWRATQWFERNAHQLHGIIICGNAVGTERSATLTPVDDSPLAIFAYPHSHRLHDLTAVCRPVSWLSVQMQTGQTVGTVIAMCASSPGWYYLPSTYFAGEAIRAGVHLIIILLV